MRISDWSSDVCSSDLIGTTMEAVAEALLNHRRLTVVTNHLTVATIINCKREFQVILAGGVLKHNDQATTGEATRELLEKLRVGSVIRSEARPVGNEGVSTVKSRWCQATSK